LADVLAVNLVELENKVELFCAPEFTEVLEEILQTKNFGGKNRLIEFCSECLLEMEASPSGRKDYAYAGEVVSEFGFNFVS